MALLSETEFFFFLKKERDKAVAFQEAAVFDYKGISNPVSLSCFLNISV